MKTGPGCDKTLCWKYITPHKLKVPPSCITRLSGTKEASSEKHHLEAERKGMADFTGQHLNSIKVYAGQEEKELYG